MPTTTPTGGARGQRDRPGRRTDTAATTPVRRSALRDALDRPLAPYYLVLGATGMLCVLGLVMVLSASSVTSFQDFGSPYVLFQRQLLWVAAGVPLLWLASRLPVRAFRIFVYPLLLVTLALLALVQVPRFGVEVGGNQNWVDFGGPFRVQPSELAKLALAVWGADLLTRKTRLLERWRHLVVPLLPVAALVTGLVLAGRDLGTALILMAIAGALLFFAGAPLRLFGGLSALAVAFVAYLSWTSGNRRERLLSFLDPTADPLGAGYQLTHSKYALGSGGWFGLGLGASREKWSWLPEQQTDFIFAIIGEELGLVGTLAVLTLFTALTYGGFRIALLTRDPFVRLAAAGITAWIVVQAMVNVGAVLGVLPVTGVPLPLVSYGGSALLPTMLALGMLLSFARHEKDAAAALAARGPGLAGRALGRLRRGRRTPRPPGRPAAVHRRVGAGRRGLGRGHTRAQGGRR